ncbi:unnamed protein product [Rotaria sp. Silwood2]|nr:unnamed protein product [Rotaria sp. Silwood2]CAF4382603.1 unnamed protein product [Rotaria sp. Silwood2]
MSRALSSNLSDPMIDEQLMYASDIDAEWEEMMLGGPASINFVGAVMVVGSKKDFSLSSNFSYHLIQYPNSFHTTIVQVANEMYRALLNAHTSMDRIQVNMRQLPNLIKTALKLITQASTSMAKVMLPRTISNIGLYANQSATIAKATFDRFTNLMDLLDEIFKASTYTNTENKLLAEQLQNQTIQVEMESENLQENIDQLASEYEEAKNRLESARDEYRQAMLNVPGGEWNAHAWNVYASNRPAVSCTGSWFWKKCRSNRDQQFNEYSTVARWKAEEALVC